MGIFSVLVVSSIGIMLQVSNAEIKAANVQAVQDTIRFSLELMTKEMRTASNYQLTTLCAPSGLEVSFDATSGKRIYFLDGAKRQIMRATQSISATDCTGSTAKVFPFTSEEIVVELLSFKLRGQLPGPLDGQPMAIIMLKISAKNPRFGAETNMNLQTTVVQRLRDL